MTYPPIRHRGRTGALRPWLLAGAALALVSTPALAQEQGQQPVEEIVVTGSRIARANLVSPSPVTQVDAAELQFTGTVNVEDLLNDLPQVVAGLTASTNNGNNGTATVDLRGLGTNRTLVLVNGRRFVGSSQDGTVDINNIPAALIDRVEVVTGGASAVYGSDAISGVVNFILKDDFEGIQLDANYGISGEGDAETWDVNLTLGGNFDNGRGNAVFSAGYLNREPLLQGERDFSRDTFTDAGGGLITLVGSTTAPAGRADNQLLNPFPGNTNYAFGPGGVARPFQSGTATGYGDTYNFGPVNYLQVPQERFNIAALASYEIVEGVEAFIEGFYINSQVDTQLAPTPVTGITVQADNPFITPSLRALLNGRPNPAAPFTIRKRTAEVGPRVSEYESQTVRVTTGLRGDFAFANRDWNWDAYFNYGRVTRDELSLGLISTQRFTDAVNCYGAGAVPGCVPLNPFGPNSISPQAAEYVTVPSPNSTEVQQRIVSASVSGDVVELPAGPLGIALGFEYREEESDFRPDFFSGTGDLQGGTNAGPVNGSFDVTEFFGELVVPVLSDMPFAQELSVEAGIRYSDYSNIGGVTTWKTGATWTPIEQVRVRGIYQKAIRAPSISELFAAAQQSFEPESDPCSASSNPSGAVAAVCAQQGLPASAIGLFEDDGQIEVTFTGSPELEEETSDTWTVGAVISPLDWLDVSIDWYSIKIEDAVASFGGGLAPLLAACFATGNANSPECSPGGTPIRRDATGEIIPFAIPNENIGELTTDGIDVQANGSYDLPNGHSVGANVLLTWVNSYDFIPNPDLPFEYKYAGTVGFSSDSAAIPEWKVNARLTYDGGPWTATYRVRWIDAVENRQIADAEAVGDAPPVLAVPEVGAVWYHDIAGQFRVGEGMVFTAGVNNVFDRQPPILPDTISANTDASTYDTIGRYFFVNASVKF